MQGRVEVDFWPKIWKLRIPPKIRDFMLRVLRDILPTKHRLQMRGLEVNLACNHCEGEEDLDHVLMKYNLG